MLALELRFPAGRYHATPWGRHVNEADVAWPPDVWRLARALIATWHRKLDSDHYPRTDLEMLLATMARADPPVYTLPPAVHAHTRHYMPMREGKSDKNTLIFDAFARLDPTAPLVMAWPDLDLDAAAERLLDALLEATGYLGRAESWLDARRAEAWAGATDCVPGDAAVDIETGEVFGDVITLHLPRAPEDYGEFRARTLETSASRNLKPAEERRLEATLPESWLSAIGVDTADLQAAGWSAPPAARRVSYVRPAQVLRPIATLQPRAPSKLPSVTSARLALYGKPLPRIEDAVRVGEWLRLAVVGKAGRLLGEDRVPATLSGHDLPAGHRHEHAFYLPEDADGDGFIDHLMVYAPGGLDASSRSVLGALTRLWTRDGLEWQIILEGMGTGEQFVESGRLLRSSREWRSVTPYLHPWHVKKRFTVEDQIRRECRERGLPEPAGIEGIAEVEVSPGQRRRAIHFHRFRSKHGLTQPDRQGSFWRLVFPEPIRGPLALGFACHFGLGLFRPAPG